MKITTTHVFEITSKEMAASYMKHVKEVICEYSQVDDYFHAECVISDTLNSIEDDMEAIFAGDVASLFRQGMSFMLVPGLINYEKELDEYHVCIYITDRDIAINSNDISY